jgi:hypothetical protein
MDYYDFRKITSVFVINTYTNPINTMAICDCDHRDYFHETEMRYIAQSNNVEFENVSLLCEFSIKQGIKCIQTRSNTTISVQNDDIIVFKCNDNTLCIGNGKMFVKCFYEQRYYYNKKEMVCEKGRRGYLDELPTDVWTIIKKYIIYDQN